jgi:hypothetical protein
MYNQKIESLGFSETLVPFYQATRRHIADVVHIGQGFRPKNQCFGSRTPPSGDFFLRAYSGRGLRLKIQFLLMPKLLMLGSMPPHAPPEGVFIGWQFIQHTVRLTP